MLHGLMEVRDSNEEYLLVAIRNIGGIYGDMTAVPVSGYAPIGCGVWPDDSDTLYNILHKNERKENNFFGLCLFAKVERVQAYKHGYWIEIKSYIQNPYEEEEVVLIED